MLLMIHNAADDKMIKKGCDQILNKRVNNMIKLSEERDTKNLMTNLPLVFGAKYFITTNLVTKYGIVNGCEVELQAIITNDFQYIDFNKFSDKEHYLEDMPLCLILKKLNNLQQEFSFSNMSSELIPFFPREETFYVNPKIPE